MLNFTTFWLPRQRRPNETKCLAWNHLLLHGRSEFISLKQLPHGRSFAGRLMVEPICKRNFVQKLSLPKKFRAKTFSSSSALHLGGWGRVNCLSLHEQEGMPNMIQFHTSSSRNYLVLNFTTFWLPRQRRPNETKCLAWNHLLLHGRSEFISLKQLPHGRSFAGRLMVEPICKRNFVQKLSLPKKFRAKTFSSTSPATLIATCGNLELKLVEHCFRFRCHLQGRDNTKAICDVYSGHTGWLPAATDECGLHWLGALEEICGSASP